MAALTWLTRSFRYEFILSLLSLFKVSLRIRIHPNRYRVLDAYLFDDLREVREIIETWIMTYNVDRPYRALGRIPLREYRNQAENNTFQMSS